MRKSFIVLFSFLFLLQSCHKKQVQLPLSKVNGIQDTIYNNSKIWLFFEITNGDTIAILNKNNKITNTHYIFNIDKRLKLKHIISHINKIHIKKEKPSMHSNGKYMHSFLSYVNSTNKKLSMVKIDSVIFKPISEMNKNLTLKFTINNKVFLNDTLVKLDELNKIIVSKIKNNKINLVFDENITYSQYLNHKAAIQLLKKDSILVNKYEFINP